MIQPTPVVLTEAVDKNEISGRRSLRPERSAPMIQPTPVVLTEAVGKNEISRAEFTRRDNGGSQ
jgi:hypothetical protein